MDEHEQNYNKFLKCHNIEMHGLGILLNKRYEINKLSYYDCVHFIAFVFNNNLLEQPLDQIVALCKLSN